MDTYKSKEWKSTSGPVRSDEVAYREKLYSACDAHFHGMLVYHSAGTSMDSDKCGSIKKFWFWFYSGGLWEFFFHILKYLKEMKKYVSKLILNKNILK